MNNKKFGFTLAEVLITLAIIGVVAALTLPTLLANYQKREWATKLIKTHAELQQGFKLLMAEDNTSQLSQTSPWKKMPEEGCYQNTVTSQCEDFAKALYSKLNGIQIIAPSEIDYYHTYLNNLNHGRALNGVKLSNGAIIWKMPFNIESEPCLAEGGMNKYLGAIYLDVNGKDKPNKMGRDIFILLVDENGNIFPVGSNSASLCRNGDSLHTWDGEFEGYNCNPNEGRGQGCAARIIETGKMDY